ncbi:hypothetical protein Ddye_013033 [Dipteronia dyeriana]|uniref:MULE transposase domain-containing protein n=1 Tax=Dipteronia dyeriana TaxID=168575 RepID=A0AAD9X5M1_9ROSI|nr:hypothetical protein Ddye_013033 [Dipteronia dyeriana]
MRSVPDIAQEGSDNQGLYVLKNLSYDELVSIVQTIVKFDENKYSADLLSISIVPGTTCRTFIRNNDDVQFMLGEDSVIPQVCASLIERPAGGVISEDISHRDNTQQFQSSGRSNQLFTERSGIDGQENRCVIPQEVAAHDNILGPQFDDVYGCQIEMNGRQYNHQYNEIYNDINNEQNITPNVGLIHEVDNEGNFNPVDNVEDNEDDEEHVQTERRVRHVQKFSSNAPDITGTSEVRANVTPYDSDNTITWVIPGAESYLFGMGGSRNLVEDEPTSMIYKGGFRTCMLPVIAVDSTHLKGRFWGTMFVTTAQDGNKQVYPNAFGYGDLENNLSWEWFVDSLKGALGYIDELVFISDRHASIEARISKEFPYVTHTICCWHFTENIKKRFHRKDVSTIMDNVDRAYTEFEYNRHMEELRNLHQNAYDYVIDADPHKWSRVHCLERRYRVMTIKVEECINSCLKFARQLPMLTLAEFIRSMLQRWFHDHYRAVQSMRHQLTDATHLVILKCMEKCGFMTVNPVDWNIFSVKGSGK